MAEGTKLADAYVQIIPISEGITGRIKDLFKDLPDEGDKAGDKTQLLCLKAQKSCCGGRCGSGYKQGRHLCIH